MNQMLFLTASRVSRSTSVFLCFCFAFFLQFANCFSPEWGRSGLSLLPQCSEQDGLTSIYFSLWFRPSQTFIHLVARFSGVVGTRVFVCLCWCACGRVCVCLYLCVCSRVHVRVFVPLFSFLGILGSKGIALSISTVDHELEWTSATKTWPLIIKACTIKEDEH